MRDAACSCGQLRLEAEGEPSRVSICHCLSCQRRTGSVFGVQAAFDAQRVQVTGRYNDYARTSDDQSVRVFHFCPDCGGTVFLTRPEEPDLVVVTAGTFADPSFPPPTQSSYGSRRHPWVELPADIQTDDAWEAVFPLYEAGDYATAADRGRELLVAEPDNAGLLFNIACCESLAAHPAAAIAHLRRAIELDSRLRTWVAEDSDFDPIREEPGFSELLAIVPRSAE